MQITAKLKNYSKDSFLNIYWGQIYDDTRKRWPNGTRIHTSNIVKLEGNLLHTLNSVYELVDNDEKE